MIDSNKRVYVYFNLHKKVWSVRQAGKVVEHTKTIALRDCKFLVAEAGRQKVLKTKTKNVHAGVSGYVVSLDCVPCDGKLLVVTYNPYRESTFVEKADREPVERSDYATLMCGDGWRAVEAIWNVCPEDSR
tara:strand:+ start:1280 stop:1672 length:393 start_codon:yes stop_codon:yes gene_type:complete